MTGRADDLVPAELVARAAALRRFRYVPEAMLAEIVAAEGLPIRQPDPAPADGATDREAAAQLCAGCPVQDECLELDLRWMGSRTTGVFAGLTDSDRRAVHALWVADQTDRPEVEGGAR